MTLIWFPNGHITGKCHSIQILKIPRKRYYSLEKNSNITHPIIYFNNVQVHRDNQETHLGIILDEKLSFKSHIDKVLTKDSKGIAVVKRLRNSLPRKSLITIYKSIIRHILTMEIYCTTNLITLPFAKKLNLFNTKQLL